MARKLKPEFITEFLTGSLNPLLEYIQNDDTLNLELRGNRVIVYYRGGAILNIHQDTYKFEGLTAQYHKEYSIIQPTIFNFESYLPEAKHIIDVYVRTEKDHLGEKDIQQIIAKENNYSPNSIDTDYFVIDTEYQDLGRFDIVAIRWDSKGSTRKLPRSYSLKITIFEVKQGYKSISGKSGMTEHFKNFNNFNLDKEKVDAFISDMIEVFDQKRELGLYPGTEKYKKVAKDNVSDEIDFIFVLSNYKHDSTQLKKELEKIENCKFIYSNPMGYGLYSRNIVDKNGYAAKFL